MKLQSVDEYITEGKAFKRLPKKVIGNELYSIKDTLSSFYNTMESGNDYNPEVIKSLSERLKAIDKTAKTFILLFFHLQQFC